MSVHDGYTIHLVIPEGRTISVYGDNYDAALESYHKIRQVSLRECTIVDHADGNGFWAMNRTDTSKTYNVRFLKDYNQAYEHALSFYDYDAVELEHDIEANQYVNMCRSDAIMTAVDAGCFLFYDDDIADFLVDYDGTELDDAEANFERYKDILVSALAI